MGFYMGCAYGTWLSVGIHIPGFHPGLQYLKCLRHFRYCNYQSAVGTIHINERPVNESITVKEMEINTALYCRKHRASKILINLPEFHPGFFLFHQKHSHL